jgi:hypothetical protein
MRTRCAGTPSEQRGEVGRGAEDRCVDGLVIAIDRGVRHAADLEPGDGGRGHEPIDLEQHGRPRRFGHEAEPGQALVQVTRARARPDPPQERDPAASELGDEALDSSIGVSLVQARLDHCVEVRIVEAGRKPAQPGLIVELRAAGLRQEPPSGHEVALDRPGLRVTRAIGGAAHQEVTVVRSSPSAGRARRPPRTTHHPSAAA